MRSLMKALPLAAGLLALAVLTGWIDPGAAAGSEDPPVTAQILGAAIDGQIASQPPVRVPGVAFSTAAAKSNQIPWLKSDGFVLRAARLLRLHDVGAVGQSQAAGRLDYADNLGRNVGFLWLANYRKTSNGVSVEHLTLAPTFDPKPRIHLALIPVAALSGGELPAFGSYAEFAALVAQHALPPDALPGRKAEYFIVLSTLDPISTSAKLDLRISPKATGTDGEESGAAHALIANWGVTVLRGTVDFSRTRTLYAKAVFTPGREAGQAPRKPVLIGVFSLKPVGS